MKIKVKAHINSRNEKIILNKDENLDIYIREKPIEGKANKKIIEVLSAYFKVKKNQILLISGEKSKNKMFEIKLQ